MEKYMKLALRQAEIAYSKEEVPIGAVIVKDGKIIAKAYNNREKSKNAVGHAEILAIMKACKKLGDWRLDDCEMYVTLEPCPMCAGAIVNARIKTLVYGADDKNSNNDLLTLICNDKRLNHNTNIISGIMKEECSRILTNFFQERRKIK